MQASEPSETERQEADRYRRAAEDTLDQLQWCVSYLNRIGKTRIAEVIDANRRVIRAGMRGDN